MKQAWFSIPFCLIIFTCDNAWDCLLNINPEINEKTIQPALKGVPYSQLITADITNDPLDEFYEFFFEVIGPLPQGLDIHFNNRSIEIYGVPEETGIYRLTVTVDIGSYDNGDDFDPNPTCNGFIQRTFVLNVLE